MSSSLPRLRFNEALRVRQSGPNKFMISFPEEFCVGTKAHGGWLISLVQAAVTLYKPTQPHVADLKVHFGRPAVPGDIEMKLGELYGGKKTSVVELRAWQQGRLLFTCLMGLADLLHDKGVTFNTHWSLLPPPMETSVAQLEAECDPHWISYQFPQDPSGYLRPTSYVKYFIPLESHNPAFRDSWLTLTDPEAVFLTEHLGFVGDVVLPVLDNFCGDEAFASYEACRRTALQQKRDRENGDPDVPPRPFTTPVAAMTLSYNMEMKRPLPAEGTRWLFLRTWAQAMINGRLDNETTILDQHGNLIAVVRQVLQVVQLQRLKGKVTDNKI